ncbi:hypothetical protein [Catellatospora tritici]|uniref:hypothetical protein n=1 Tax=Catellatospora tritici TaxID=2851566 RepID=UPI001C2D7A2F|nr:hypothetical protein [Catellatospora tritici]MBV1854870.1 hypothetical protein [Catellatospora tritici]
MSAIDAAPPVAAPQRAAAPRPPRRVRVSPYLIVSAVLVAYAALIAWRQPWIGDFGLHAAVVERLRQDLLNPGDPMIDADLGSPYYSPYTVLLGLVARLTGATAVTVLTVAAPACVAFLLYGIRCFVRAFTPSRWAPVLAVAVLLLLWGAGTPSWSGFLNLRGLPYIMPYPSTVALGLTLLWLALLVRTPDDARFGRWALIGLLFGTIALIHQFTGFEAAIAAVGLMLHRLRGLRAARVATAITAAAALILAWPYYSMLEVGGAVGGFDDVHRPLYQHLWSVYALPLALCLPALALRVRRRLLDPLACVFVLAVTVVAVGGLTGHWSTGRAWPLVMVAAQVALAVELTDALSTRGGPARSPRTIALYAWATAVVVGCALGAHYQFNAVVMVPDGKSVRFADRTSWLTDRLSPGDVVVTDSVGLDRNLLAHGVRFVTPPWPHPLPGQLTDLLERDAALAELTAPGTPEARRRELVRQFRVHWIIDTHGTWSWADALATEIVAGPGKQRLLRLADPDPR